MKREQAIAALEQARDSVLSVRVLLDENLPHDLIAALAVHTVSTVQGLRWARVENGELLRRAIGHADAVVTIDRRHVGA